MTPPHYFDPLSPRGGSAHTSPNHHAQLHYSERGGDHGRSRFCPSSCAWIWMIRPLSPIRAYKAKEDIIHKEVT